MIGRAKAWLFPFLPIGPARRLPGVTYTEAPSIERMVFICGLHRSGTTLLERMLVERFEVACLRASVPESEGQHMQGVFSPARAFGGPGRFAFDPGLQAEMERIGTSEDVRAAILADWARFVVGEAPVLIEKSPPNLVRIDWLRRVFPGARFVVVARDPRAVAGATRKWSRLSLADLVRHWDAAYGRALTQMGEDCMTLTYEDLCADPGGELARIADFAGLAHRPAPGGVEPRFGTLRNSNADYIARHGGRTYGPGAWEAFGYDI